MTLVSVEWGLIAINVCIALANTALVVVVFRLLRRVAMLDVLLSKIAVDSFLSHHLPTFRAWQFAMGRLEVTVTPVRRDVEEMASEREP